jgi:hypothetical protein
VSNEVSNPEKTEREDVIENIVTENAGGAAATGQTRKAGKYNPNALLDHVMATMRLQSDRALAIKLNIRPRLIAMIRDGKLAISASMLMWMQQISGLSVTELRAALGDQRGRVRLNLA